MIHWNSKDGKLFFSSQLTQGQVCRSILGDLFVSQSTREFYVSHFLGQILVGAYIICLHGQIFIFILFLVQFPVYHSRIERVIRGPEVNKWPYWFMWECKKDRCKKASPYAEWDSLNSLFFNITFPTQSCLLLASFCTNLLHSLIIPLTV